MSQEKCTPTKEDQGERNVISNVKVPSSVKTHVHSIPFPQKLQMNKIDTNFEKIKIKKFVSFK